MGVGTIMSDKICRLVKTIKKDYQWVKFILPDAREIRFLVRDDKCGDKKKSKLIIDCPIETKIEFEDNDRFELPDNIGNC